MQSGMFDRRDHPGQYTADWAKSREDLQRQKEAAAAEEAALIEQRRRSSKSIPHNADWHEERT